jgi:23S rRNA (guanosine2251-2'-O)-methyltransferase
MSEQTDDFDIVVGLHSIIECLKNPYRHNECLFLTEEAVDLFKKKHNYRIDKESVKFRLLAAHELNEEAKRFYKKKDLEFSRIPSNAFLITSSIENKDAQWVYEQLKLNKNFRAVYLDQVQDVHNAAAILRTISFYNLDALIIPSKKSFGVTPGFYRIASGATEHVPIITISNEYTFIQKSQELGLKFLALSEHAEKHIEKTEESKLCVVMGNEELGISASLLRLIAERRKINSMGKIKSLNVSIATAVVLEKLFGQNC